MLYLPGVLRLILVLASTGREMSTDSEPVSLFGCLLLFLRHDASCDSIISRLTTCYTGVA